MEDRRVLILSTIVASVVLIVLSAVWIYINFDIVNEGQILPYTDHYIYEVLIAEKFRLYIQPELALTEAVINSVVLLGVCYVSMTFAVLLIRSGKSSRQVIAFFALMSAGGFYLAADESFGIHETVGHNMQFLTEIPGISRPDDFLIVTYGVVAILFLFYFRSVYLNKRRPLIYFGTTILLYAGVAISDVMELPLEEALEIAASMSLLFGAMSLGISLLDEIDT